MGKTLNLCLCARSGALPCAGASNEGPQGAEHPPTAGLGRHCAAVPSGVLLASWVGLPVLWKTFNRETPHSFTARGLAAAAACCLSSLIATAWPRPSASPRGGSARAQHGHPGGLVAGSTPVVHTEVFRVSRYSVVTPPGCWIKPKQAAPPPCQQRVDHVGSRLACLEPSLLLEHPFPQCSSVVVEL